MSSFLKEKIKIVADRNVWSLEHARGFVDGEAARRRGKAPSRLTLVGIDEYCLGFRAGYFERQDRGSVASAQREHPGRAAGSPELR